MMRAQEACFWPPPGDFGQKQVAHPRRRAWGVIRWGSGVLVACWGEDVLGDGMGCGGWCGGGGRGASSV